MKHYEQDEYGKKTQKQTVYATKLAMSIRDSGLVKDVSASYLAKYFTIDTLKEMSEEKEPFTA